MTLKEFMVKMNGAFEGIPGHTMMIQADLLFDTGDSKMAAWIEGDNIVSIREDYQSSSNSNAKR